MSTAHQSAFPTIDRISVTAATIPTDFPESDGTLAWDKTTIVIVEVSSGKPPASATAMPISAPRH